MTEVPAVKFLLFPGHGSPTIRISNQHLYRAGDHDTDYNKAFRIRTGRAVLLPHVYPAVTGQQYFIIVLPICLTARRYQGNGYVFLRVVHCFGIIKGE